MRTHRVYLESYPLTGEIQIEGEVAHYLGRVLRVKVDQPVIVFDGKGNEHLCRVDDIQKKSLRLSIQNKSPITPLPNVQITLIQGVSKGDRMDTVVQKATELGVSHIIPVLCEYNAVKLDEQRWQKKQQHWHQIAVSACEQSMRHDIPQVHPVTTLENVLRNTTMEHRVLLHPSTSPLPSLINETSDCITLAVGPEGGFSEIEVAFAQQHGWEIGAIGPRILRTETAAIAAVSCIQLLLGDFNC